MLTAALSTVTSSRLIPSTDSNPNSHHTESNSLNVTNNSNSNSNNNDLGSKDASPPSIRLVPHLNSPRSLVFGVIERDVANGTILKIGRFTDKYISQTKITFKSKVVSRGHAEIWSDNNKFYIRDTKSSSGTFLNQARLSPPGQESRAFQLSDGDVVQLGVDYQGGAEEIYRCVKMRIELNRNKQQKRNAYSLNTFQTLRNLTTPPNNVSVLDAAMGFDNDPSKAHIDECCICLYAIAPFQALFVAPCSHTFHYKCVRPLLSNHPGFQCPLCRSYADLDDSVAIEASEVLEMLKKDKVKQDGIVEQEVPLAEVGDISNFGSSLRLTATLTDDNRPTMTLGSNSHELTSVNEENGLEN
ncbi:SMAD/FHA domain-containing protein [Phycomyces nitens]|nr:SMAD/FHA domain-containing protein [Phycomyces nitens]